MQTIIVALVILLAAGYLVRTFIKKEQGNGNGCGCGGGCGPCPSAGCPDDSRPSNGNPEHPSDN